MIQRKISTTEVESILRQPDGVIPQSQDKSIYYKGISGRTDNSIAAVTLVKSGDVFEVITVMIDFEVA